MAKYRVTNRGAILQGSRLYQPGERISDGTFTGDQIKEHIKSGFLVKVGADDDFGNDPGVAPVPSDLDLTGKEGEKKAPHLKNMGQDPKTAEALEKLRMEGKWKRNPDSLKDMTLEELNTVIIETDHTVDPFKTKKEAIAWLSQDFHG